MPLDRAIANLKALPGYQMKSERELREVVLAVLEGVREPSEGMLDAARDPIWDFSQDYAPTERDPGGQIEDSAEHVAAKAYRAMIDHLIAEAGQR